MKLIFCLIPPLKSHTSFTFISPSILLFWLNKLILDFTMYLYFCLLVMLCTAFRNKLIEKKTALKFHNGNFPSESKEHVQYGERAKKLVEEMVTSESKSNWVQYEKKNSNLITRKHCQYTTEKTYVSATDISMCDTVFIWMRMIEMESHTLKI